MIVRIATEGQFRFDDAHLGELNELDNACVAAVDAGDEPAFQETYDAMLALVRSSGSELSDEELTESTLILPPPDLTFAEAGEHFTGEGLVPD